MRVKIWPPGAMLKDGTSNDGCTEYRLLMPARPLIAGGADIEFDSRGPTVLWDKDWSGFLEPPESVRAVALARRPDCDVVVMQRPARRWWADIIPMLKALGIRVVVDVDDLFDSIDRGNLAHGVYDPNKSSIHNHLWVDIACQHADVVTCTTPALLERYGHGHGVLLPNLVPERYLKIDAEARPHTLGWSGTVETHPTDLQVTRGAVGKALSETGWAFHHIGTGKGVKKALGLFSKPTFTNWVPFAEYAYRMAELNVGIVPLADTKFNDAKSSLKMIEMAALGVPVLASATPDNLRMHKFGVGAIVKHPGQWSRSLDRILKDQDYREHLAGSSREVMADHTYEKQCWRWAQAWGLEKA